MAKPKRFEDRSEEIKAILLIMIKWLTLEDMLEISEAMRQEGMRRGEGEFWKV